VAAARGDGVRCPGAVNRMFASADFDGGQSVRQGCPEGGVLGTKWGKELERSNGVVGRCESEGAAGGRENASERGGGSEVMGETG